MYKLKNLESEKFINLGMAYIGYENAAKTAKKAYKENISLKEACVALGFLTAEQFDEVFHPEQMV